jgi:hypothetical protein
MAEQLLTQAGDDSLQERFCKSLSWLLLLTAFVFGLFLRMADKERCLDFTGRKAGEEQYSGFCLAALVRCSMCYKSSIIPCEWF